MWGRQWNATRPVLPQKKEEFSPTDCALPGCVVHCTTVPLALPRKHYRCWALQDLTLHISPRRNSTVTFHFNKTPCSFFPLYSTHSNLIHLIMWLVTMVAMNPAAEIQKTDKKSCFSPLHPPWQSQIFLCLDDKSNLNTFLLLTQLCEQEKKKKKTEEQSCIRIEGIRSTVTN